MRDLTAREMEIAELVGAAKRRKEIAAELGISVTTVSTHLRSIRNKLDIHDRVDLARWVWLAKGREPKAAA